jgi:transposase-like protein
MSLAQLDEMLNNILYICSPLFILDIYKYTIIEGNSMYKTFSFFDFQDRFHSEQACWDYLVHHRWPHGFVCPVCSHTQSFFIRRRRLFQCQRCRTQVSVTAHTIFHKTRTPLKKWFWAIFLSAQQKKGISALQLQKFLEVKAYKTAWTMLHKIRQAMAQPEGTYQLAGLIELDDAYIGSKSSGGKRGRGAPHKTLVLAAVEVPRNKKPRFAMLKVAPNLEQETIKPLIESRIEKNSTLKTDAYSSFHFLPKEDYHHFPKVLDTQEKISEHLHWVHILISNFKNTLRAIFHGVSSKYIQRYLNEYIYRFNQRFWETQLFDRLLFECVNCKNISLAELRT